MPRRRVHRAGYSLIELLVAIILIDVGVLAVVQTNAVLVRRRNEIRLRAAAVAAAASRIERLVAVPCAAVSGAAVTPAYTEAWAVQPATHSREISDSVSFGAGGSHWISLRTGQPC